LTGTGRPPKPERFVDGRMLIGGTMVESAGGGWLEIANPADESVIGRVPRGNAADVDLAVAAAKEAQPRWRALEVADRARLVRELAGALDSRKAELTEIEVLDTGNAMSKARGDVSKAVRQMEYYAGLGYELKGETVPSTQRNLHLTWPEPYGVVGRITPFNHPVMFAASRLAAPLMAGNTIVIKVAEQAPLSPTLLGELCRDVLPPGVVNIVTGLGAEAGDALVRHPGVKRLAFTGSVPTGLAVQRAAAETTVKDVTLELGGKNPLVIFPDADFETALDGAVKGMNFSWQGQSCGSTSRLFVHESQYARALSGLVERVRRIRVGDPFDETVHMGPLITADHLQRVQRSVALARAEGAELVHGGGRPSGEGFDRGYWMEPTVFAGVSPAMTIFGEEIFGPVLSVTPWSDRDELVAMVNSVDYGLAASIWTRDLTQALSMAKEVEAGTVWVNGVSLHHTGLPFGGTKLSGVGREEGLGELLSYTECKSVSIYL
jgi:betaine-aldehyde dehydrogenase